MRLADGCLSCFNRGDLGQSPIFIRRWDVGVNVNIVECLDFEQAVTTARRLNRYEFLMTFTPLPVEGRPRSLLNPMAIRAGSAKSSQPTPAFTRSMWCSVVMECAGVE